MMTSNCSHESMELCLQALQNPFIKRMDNPRYEQVCKLRKTLLPCEFLCCLLPLTRGPDCFWYI